MTHYTTVTNSWRKKAEIQLNFNELWIEYSGRNLSQKFNQTIFNDNLKTYVYIGISWLGEYQYCIYVKVKSLFFPDRPETIYVN